jgi:hypothetical protein
MYHEFKKFILENKKENNTIPYKKPEKYLSHLEDAMIDHGHEGVNLIANYLDDAHNLLTGHKAKSNYQIKYDSNRSIIFGIDKKTQQFFIASKKSPHDKDYKVSSKEDISKKNGSSSDLVIAFYHLPKILPKDIRPGESYIAEIMHTNKNISVKKGHVNFSPNSITYSAHIDSPHGATAKKSKIGVVVHTKNNADGTSVPIDKKMRSKFINHPDVHNIDPTLAVDPKNYTPENIKEYFKHRDSANKLYKSMSPESFDATMKHSEDLHKYINHEHNNVGEVSIQNFINYFEKYFKDSLGKSKTDKNKKEKTSKHSSNIDSIYNHKIHIEKVLKLHNHLMNAKNILFHAMCKSIPWLHSLNGIPISPEGIVAFGPDGTAIKYVDRTAYSKPNIDNKGK